MADAENDGVKVPVTLEEYCVQASTSRNEQDDDCILGNPHCSSSFCLF